jgi:hypothetical protein
MAVASTQLDEQIQIRTVLDFYERTLKPLYEPGRNGDYIALDAVSLDYEIDASSIAARGRLKQRRPDADFVTLEVGRPIVKGLIPPFPSTFQDGAA